MLAAAVAGEVFASPSEDAVLAAIRAVTGPAGDEVGVLGWRDRGHCARCHPGRGWARRCRAWVRAHMCFFLLQNRFLPILTAYCHPAKCRWQHVLRAGRACSPLKNKAYIGYESGTGHCTRWHLDSGGARR